MNSIVFENVSKEYSPNVGIKNVSITIGSGEFAFLVGECGAGKTTLIRLILKEIEADSGKIYFEGKDITHIGRREIPYIRQRIGVVFQDFRLLEKKTVYENVAFAMEILHKGKKEIRDRVPFVLDLVGLSNKENMYPHELSAGEQQRVGIARAIVNKPRLLICDEPTGNLDYKTAREIMDVLERINSRGTTVIMATHAIDIVKQMKKRVITLQNGTISSDRNCFDISGELSSADDDVVEELVKLFEHEKSTLTTQERRTIYKTKTTIAGSDYSEDLESFLREYLKDN